MRSMPASLAAVAVFVLALACGTGSTLSAKLMYQLEVTNSVGEMAHYSKPVFISLLAFVSLVPFWPLHYISHYCTSGLSVAPSPLPRNYILKLAPLACLDVFATIAVNAGLMYVSGSMYQLSGATCIVFVSAFRILLRIGKPFEKHNYLGVALISLSFGLSSGAAMVLSDAGGPDDGGDVATGLALCMLGNLFFALQVVWEEIMMTDDGSEPPTPPLVLVGVQGCWGVCIILALCPLVARLPGSDVGGCLENLADTLAMFASPDNSMLRLLAVAFVVSIGCSTAAGSLVTYLLDGVWRSILKTLRPVALWATNLSIYYLFSEGEYGEHWTTASWFQLVGMLGMLCGIYIYNGPAAPEEPADPKDVEAGKDTAEVIDPFGPVRIAVSGRSSARRSTVGGSSRKTGAA